MRYWYAAGPLLAYCICFSGPTLGGNVASESSRKLFLLDVRDDGFDLSGRNRNRGTRWTKVNPDDGFLAIDITALRASGIDISTASHTHVDGVILVSSGLRVSAKGQPREGGNCWQLLSVLDTNRDGKLDSKDPAWGALRLFVDRNGDGSLSSREMLTLAEVDLRDITVNPSPTRSERTDGHGNVLLEGASSRNDGSTRPTAEVLLARVAEAEDGVAFR